MARRLQLSHYPTLTSLGPLTPLQRKLLDSLVETAKQWQNVQVFKEVADLMVQEAIQREKEGREGGGAASSSSSNLKAPISSASAPQDTRPKNLNQSLMSPSLSPAATTTPLGQVSAGSTQAQYLSSASAPNVLKNQSIGAGASSNSISKPTGVSFRPPAIVKPQQNAQISQQQQKQHRSQTTAVLGNHLQQQPQQPQQPRTVAPAHHQLPPPVAQSQNIGFSAANPSPTAPTQAQQTHSQPEGVQRSSAISARDKVASMLVPERSTNVLTLVRMSMDEAKFLAVSMRRHYFSLPSRAENPTWRTDITLLPHSYKRSLSEADRAAYSVINLETNDLVPMPEHPSDQHIANLKRAQILFRFRMFERNPKDYEDSPLYQAWISSGSDGEVLLLCAKLSAKISLQLSNIKGKAQDTATPAKRSSADEHQTQGTSASGSKKARIENNGADDDEDDLYA